MTDTPPLAIGSQPRNADELSQLVGSHLRAFLNVKNSINQDRDFLQASDLKVPPYNYTADQETLTKTAILELDTALDSVDMTFISRLIGLY